MNKKPKLSKALRVTQIEEALRALQEAGQKISFVAVAETVGVSAAYIHNKFPEQAQMIRSAAGIVQSDTEEALRKRVAELSDVNSRLTFERDELRRDLAKQASINEALRRQRNFDRALADGKVIRFLPSRDPARDN